MHLPPANQVMIYMRIHCKQNRQFTIQTWCGVARFVILFMVTMYNLSNRSWKSENRLLLNNTDVRIIVNKIVKLIRVERCHKKERNNGRDMSPGVN